MTKDEVIEYFDEQLALAEGDDVQTTAWVALRFDALKFIDEGTDPTMVMVALTMAIEEEKAKRGL